MKPAHLIQPTGAVAAAVRALIDSDGHVTPIRSNISWSPADDDAPASPLASCVSPLQARHAAAKAHASAIVQAHPGKVVSLFNLGQQIAEIEDQSTRAFQDHQPHTGLALHAVAQRLKTLIPVPVP
jgi:hypothetical protein